MVRLWLLSVLIFSLAACQPAPTDQASGLTAGEAEALNDAAAELDAKAGATASDEPGINPAAKAALSANRHRTGPHPE